MRSRLGRLELDFKEKRVPVTVTFKVEGSYSPTMAHLISGNLAKLVEKTFEMKNSVRPYTMSVLPTEDRKFWVISFSADCATVEQADKRLVKLVAGEKTCIDAYAEQILMDREVYEVYMHFKNEALTLPVAEVVSWITAPIPAVPYSKHGFFVPFRKTYKSLGTVQEDWLTGNQDFKSVIARNVLMNERYQNFIGYIKNSTGQDLSNVPKSWVFKAFNLPFIETIPATEWDDQDSLHNYLRGVERSMIAIEDMSKSN